MSFLLSNFYPKADAVLTSGNQSINGRKTFNEFITTPEIRGSGLAGANRKIDLQEGHLYGGTFPSVDYWRRLLSGNWQFQNRPTVSGIGVLLQGEAAGGGTVILPNDILFTTGAQIITGPKNFITRPTFNNSDLITTGDLVNLELNIEGLLSSSADFNGNRPIRRLPVLDTNYGGTTISGFLNNLFFPYANAELTLNNFPIRTYGYDTINAVTFNGSLNFKDDNVTGIACLFNTTILNGPPNPAITNNTYSISPVNFLPLVPPVLNRTSTSTESFVTRIFGTRNASSFTQDSSPVRLRFEPPYFYGISNNINLGIGVTGLTRINPTGSNGLTNSLYPTYTLGTRPSQINGLQFQFNNTIPNGYIYFAYPDFQNTLELINNWGLLAASAGIVDAVSFADYSSTYTNSTVQINFPTRSNIIYRIYRSPLITPVSLPTTFTLNFKFA